MKTAQIADGQIVEFLAAVPGFEIEDCFHPDFLATLVQVPDNAEVGWTLQNGTWAAPPPPPPPTKEQLQGYAAAKRYAIEVGGITVGGVAVATDDRSKTMIMGARVAAEADTGFTTPWIASDGSVHTLDAATMIAISDAVLAHVRDCFEKFVTVLGEITGGSVTTVAEVDAAFGGVTP